MADKREKWAETISTYSVNNLVFLDESGVNTNMTHIYGRAMGGNRCVDHTPINTPKSTTILSSIRLNGKTEYTTYSGGTTGDKFVEYLKNTLLPTLKSGDVLIMDNMRSHKVKEVKEVVEKFGVVLLYLPPYSPDLNPIEKMWSKIKSILRKLKVRILDELTYAIQHAFSKVSANDCRGWFESCGMLL